MKIESGCPRPVRYVIVRSAHLVVSAGTSYWPIGGRCQQGFRFDASLPARPVCFATRCRYGYAAVGTVCAAGDRVAKTWVGRRVFCFHPHASHIVVDPAGLFPSRMMLTFRDAVFLANMETA